MELRHLRYFVAIAEERGFTRAGGRLWVTQSGLSQQILTLERELGVKLFERLSRGVELTDAGTIFLERARDALLAAEAANAVGRDIRAGLFGSIKLGVASGARWRWTPAVLQQLARRVDGLELSVLEGYGGAVSDELRTGRLDAVIAPAGYASADLQRLSLGAEPWMVVISRSHDLAARSGPLSAADLEGQLIALTTHRDGAEYDRAVASILDWLDVRARFIRAVPTPGLPRQPPSPTKRRWFSRPALRSHTPTPSSGRSPLLRLWSSYSFGAGRRSLPRSPSSSASQLTTESRTRRRRS